MSKMDALRAMREAKYEKNRTAKPAGAGAARPKAAAAAKAPAPKASPTPPATDDAGSERLCGHKNMGGRTCTREHGHEAKSHRYS